MVKQFSRARKQALNELLGRSSAQFSAEWRIEDGKTVRVGYRIYAGPDGKEPRIPGVTPRCEYGIEILPDGAK
jgi:hypothetical protein